jgi:hypothetical protein
VAGVRWPVSKLHQAQTLPLVIGFAGSVGTADRLFAALATASFRGDMMDKRRKLQTWLDGLFRPEYVSASARSNPAPNVHGIGIWGLGAAQVKDRPGLLEYELSGDSCWHEHFHAIGSGAQTAYAVYRSLGGQELCKLGQRTALTALVRILRTCIGVEAFGVSEPIHIWRATERTATQIGDDELNTHGQLVNEWEKDDRERLFQADAGS